MTLVCTYLNGQNLIPNGGFEMSQGNCAAPNLAFSNLESWYAVNATPDYFKESCGWDPLAAVFWVNQDTAAQGEGFVGLSCRFNANETYTTEGIAAKLNQPLDPLMVYQFELTFRSQGFFQGFPDSLISCPLRPNKSIDINLSRDSILLQDDISMGQPSLSGSRRIRLASDEITEHGDSPWTTITSCLVAAGGEEYISISLPFGDFGALPPCTMEDNDATFYTFYFDIDNVSLTPLEFDIESRITICPDEEVDLLSLGVIEMEGLQVAWEDGVSELVRSDLEEDTYSIRIRYPCLDFDHELEVSVEDCQQDLYIPNVFAPNSASRNARWSPKVSEAFEFSSMLIKVFDRWGGEVYTSTNVNEGWDGSFRGRELSAGSYVYRVEIIKDNEVDVQTGAVTLIR